ncbi:MAG: hypothetical protein KAG37_00885, partial [Flavobacteriales bacterium]|nr:hypothetical protein [Flavobacteriales bacterium]
IKAGTWKGDGSLDAPSIDSSSYIFDSTKISNVMATRSIRVIISWKGNPIPYAKPDPSFYFKMNSDIVLTTLIKSGE